MRLVFLIVATLVVQAGSVYSDTVYLYDGRLIEGEILEETTVSKGGDTWNVVVIRSPGGLRYQISAEKIRKIEIAPSSPSKAGRQGKTDTISKLPLQKSTKSRNMPIYIGTVGAGVTWAVLHYNATTTTRRNTITDEGGRTKEMALISGGVGLLFGLFADVAMGGNDGGSTKRLSYFATVEPNKMSFNMRF